MRTVTITALRQTTYPDLTERLENVQDVPCEVPVGSVFSITACRKPEGLCDSAWETLRPFCEKLLRGEGNFFDGWMQNPNAALLSCNDGFRPMSFYLEMTEE